MVRSDRVDPTVGLMDSAYFTGRKEIIYFFNNLLHMNLTKIEQTATGAVACQLMDYIFPGSVPMKRVNWEAKSDFQYIENYKLLQAAFTKHNVQKYVHVDRLIRGKYQDNLEFCQWLKAFFEHVCIDPRANYKPVTRRIIGKGGRNLQPHFCPQGISEKVFVHKTFVTSPSSQKAPLKKSTFTVSRTSLLANKVGSNKDPPCIKNKVLASQKSQLRDTGTRIIDSSGIKKKSELLKKNSELSLILEGMEKERDFYFEKLRGIEVILQMHEGSAEISDVNNLIAKISRVLYSKLDVDISDNEEVCLLVHSIYFKV